MKAPKPSERAATGVAIVVRRPNPDTDVERMITFFEGLPASVKHQLRYNVSDRGILVARLREVDDSSHWRLVAEVDGRIVADATLDRDPYGWTRHIAVLRVVSNPGFDKKGVRQALCDELVKMARAGGVERITTGVLPQHTDYIQFLESLGFTLEIVRKDYAKGVDGRLHDLIIMTNDLETVWRHLEESLHEMDTRYSWYSGE